MKIRKRLNRASAHEDVESWPDVVTIRRFDLSSTYAWSSRFFDWSLGLVILFVLMLLQIPEIGEALSRIRDTRIAETAVSVAGNTKTGVHHMKELLRKLGFTIMEDGKHSGYNARVQKIVKNGACTKDTVRFTSVQLRTIIRERNGRPVHDLMSKVRTRMLSCEPTRYREGLAELIRDLIVQDELYYQYMLVDVPTQYRE